MPHYHEFFKGLSYRNLIEHYAVTGGAQKYIKDNFIRFWFRFVYSEKARLELSDAPFVLEKMRENFVDNHVAFVYESVCQEEVWQLEREGRLNINKLGRWGNNIYCCLKSRIGSHGPQDDWYRYLIPYTEICKYAYFY